MVVSRRRVAGIGGDQKRKILVDERRMRTETAEWDAATDSWKPPSGYQLSTFRADGNVSHGE